MSLFPDEIFVRAENTSVVTADVVGPLGGLWRRA